MIVKPIDSTNEILNIARELPEYFNPAGLEQIEKDTKTNMMFGAFDNDKMIGFVMYKEINLEVVEMTWLGVKPKNQGKGIGTKLVVDTLELMRQKYKVCMIKTLSDKDNYEPYKKTRDFHKSMGFIALETIDPYPGWDDPCQIFVKFL